MRAATIFHFHVDVRKGSGSHYRVRLGDRITTMQQKLNPGRIERLLKQLEIEMTDL